MSEQHTNTVPAWRNSIFLSGWTRIGNSTLDVIEPATGEVLDVVGFADAQHVAQAVDAACAAQPAWADTFADARASTLRRVAAYFEEHRAEIIDQLIRESGSIRPKAEYEVSRGLSELYEAAALPTQPEGLLLPSGDPGRLSVARRIPIGIVGVITPWNLPLVLALRSVAPAIALGNAVVLKPDPKTPIIGGMIIAEAFRQAGLPDGVLSVLPGAAEVGDALVRHPAVNMISFTGSTVTGRNIGRVAGEALKKVSLELGGKNALVILDDADLDRAASAGAYGSFLHQGQICIATGRHLVHRKIAARYAELLAQKARNLPVGDPFREPVALGPIISRQQLERIDGFVQASVSQGAELLAGAQHRKLFYQPTVLTNVSPGMDAFDHEIFGPVAAITVFDDDDEAAALANQGEYGLAAAVQGQSLGRAMSLARKIRAGMVHVNDQTVVYDAHAPFGGVKSSGNGTRYGSTSSHEEFTTLQWVTMNETIPAYPF
jgi:benzaldehyde dehydrogenase (NAD)